MPDQQHPETHVVVDGSNIATEGRNDPSLEQLDEAVRAFLKQHPHDTLTVVVDATFQHRIGKGERDAYEDAIEHGEMVTPPAGAIGRGDAFVLEIADRTDATVLSNDSFQEFHGEHPWLFDEGRLVGGKPVPNVGWVFMPRVPVRGPASRRATRAKKAERSPQPKVREEPEKPAPARDAEGVHLNDRKTFEDFRNAHPLGSTVEGTVEAFTSHGAHVTVDGARCYVPIKAMGDPIPRSARDVLTEDGTHQLVVDRIDEQRRGFDLAVPGFESDEAKAAQARPAEQGGEKKSGGRRRRGLRRSKDK